MATKSAKDKGKNKKTQKTKTKSIDKKAKVKPEKKIIKKTPEPKTKKQTKKSNSSDINIEKLINCTKQDIIEEYAQKKGDTGSPEVQVAIATQKIYKLTKHLEENPKDNHSRRGLLKIIAKRRRLLNYLQTKYHTRYKGLIDQLGLKK